MKKSDTTRKGASFWNMLPTYQIMLFFVGLVIVFAAVFIPVAIYSTYPEESAEVLSSIANGDFDFSGKEEDARPMRADADVGASDEKKPESETPLANNFAPVKLVRDQLVTPVGNGQDDVTIMIYLNGSNLETDYGFATKDVEEMLSATLSKKVHITIQTMGTREWQRYDIASDHTQRYVIENRELVLKDDSLGQLNCTDPETLSDFIKWSARNYPADRYFLILWNHGGGPVDGFGYDQWGSYSDALTIDELQQALNVGGVTFDFIGFDACIMASLEICYSLYDYCDYCILSEDFESALGWSYKGWLSQLTKNTSIPTPELAATLIDDMVSANRLSTSGDSSTLALIDQRYVPKLFDVWMDFAYANEQALLSSNYSREVIRTGRSLPVSRAGEDLAEYYITDLLAIASSVPSAQSKPLIAQLIHAVAYYNCSADNVGLTGLSVTLPYGNRRFYNSLNNVFAAAGVDQSYISWLGKFVSANSDNYYDYDDFDQNWNGWDDFNYDFFTN